MEIQVRILIRSLEKVEDRNSDPETGSDEPVWPGIRFPLWSFWYAWISYPVGKIISESVKYCACGNPDGANPECERCRLIAEIEIVRAT